MHNQNSSRNLPEIKALTCQKAINKMRQQKKHMPLQNENFSFDMLKTLRKLNKSYPPQKNQEKSFKYNYQKYPQSPDIDCKKTFKLIPLNTTSVKKIDLNGTQSDFLSTQKSHQSLKAPHILKQVAIKIQPLNLEPIRKSLSIKEIDNHTKNNSFVKDEFPSISLDPKGKPKNKELKIVFYKNLKLQTPRNIIDIMEQLVQEINRVTLKQITL